MEKEIKRQVLLELVDYVTSNDTWCTEKTLNEILAMIAANLFRSLKPVNVCLHDPEEDAIRSDPTWPHLQIVYEFFLRLITNAEPDSKLFKVLNSLSFQNNNNNKNLKDEIK
ncbi:hypothetical protein RFI_27619 [Reticulomyxa filosa]|uniref:Uncharacterized protein n=1 Tax=Reticulomyxa filosa TaxID=46433 RepID=X6M6Y4_RETFI|nr:hypothetical protein RFI_27619 [Reticulomyxa filosa]|eukprot:ETO09758.1 hypothetical protein RFI_27619 [Reticulomyxa filosa]